LIWDNLTVDEHLNMIGSIKGLSSADVEFQRELIKQTLDLTHFGNKLAGNLSGGNKRKLCCAISLLANPLVEFLDEPTTGVDPISRRSLFKLLKHLKKSAIMLTTHRMDEAEALCDKIAIMINGRFVCLGSPGHLKQKYGGGYQLKVTVAQGKLLDNVHAIIVRDMPGSVRDIAPNQGPTEQIQASNEIYYKIRSLG
jgi:ATP-binding cassette, subfamily A (ABC1), member 3